MIKAVVTDIEGTTSSLSFVKDVLFPYARANIADFVRNNRDQPEVATLLQEVRKEAELEYDPETLISQLIDWIDQDRKVIPLKSMQGLIWETGYLQGDFQGHIYPDAVEVLRKWKNLGIDLYIYSSGSVHAQKLLFGHTAYGDLKPLFTGYFDTHAGGKKEAQSYRRIADRIKTIPQEILFMSDIEDELNAAGQTGIKTCWLVRDRDVVDRYAAHLQARNFNEIHLEKFQ